MKAQGEIPVVRTVKVAKEAVKIAVMKTTKLFNKGNLIVMVILKSTKPFKVIPIDTLDSR